jgi:carnitine-CoA ligase
MITTEQIRAALAADRSVPRLLTRRADELGDKALLRCGGVDRSYADVDADADAIAGGLRAAGIDRGDRVALMMNNSVDWIAFWLGAMKVGAITVTINTAHKGEGLAYLLGHSQSRLLALDPEFAPSVAALRDQIPLPLIYMREGDEIDALPAARPLAELRQPRGQRDSIELKPSDPCSILYTSGTTGPPKGCLLPHGQYVAAAHLHASNCGYDGDTTLYTCLPLFHINAQNYSLLSAMAAGGTLALDQRFSASRFWERIATTEATAFNFIGAMAVALWNQPPDPADAAHRARIAFGVPIPTELWERWEARFNCHVIYAYGMTENALPAIYPREDLPAKPALRGAAGRASPTSEILVVDDDDNPVGPGTVGEILTRPRIPWTMMIEYVDRPDATAAAFRNCWFHTGDLGYVDQDGFLFYVDRKKDALRRRGEMVSSWEVERLVAKFPGVVECAVVGVPSAMTEDDILVAVVTVDGRPIHAPALIRFCEEHTARFQVPRYVRTVAELPRTQTQRVEKYRLRDEGVTADTWDAEAAAASADRSARS